eukprot:1776190-Prymnesium_polylepis.1
MDGACSLQLAAWRGWTGGSVWRGGRHRQRPGCSARLSNAERSRLARDSALWLACVRTATV